MSDIIFCRDTDSIEGTPMVIGEDFKEWHCRVCHTSWLPRSRKIPNRCANQKCKTMKWNRWPEDFDINKCSCPDCMVLFRKEHARLKDEQLSQSKKNKVV